MFGCGLGGVGVGRLTVSGCRRPIRERRARLQAESWWGLVEGSLVGEGERGTRAGAELLVFHLSLYHERNFLIGCS